MPAERFFIDSALEERMEIILEGSEFHHLAHVMRIDEGDITEIVNGQGALARAQLKRREKKKALFEVESVLKQEKPSKKIILAQALPRINRLDFIIEKGTELGATEFWLFPGQLSERKLLTEHQIERLKGQIIASMKQCGRLFLPEIKIRPSINKWERLELPGYFGDLSENAPHFLKVYKGDSSLFFIGPESGFTENEQRELQKLGAQGVKLHPNILRTDTAALVALTLLGI